MSLYDDSAFTTDLSIRKAFVTLPPLGFPAAFYAEFAKADVLQNLREVRNKLKVL